MMRATAMEDDSTRRIIPTPMLNTKGGGGVGKSVDGRGGEEALISSLSKQNL